LGFSIDASKKTQATFYIKEGFSRMSFGSKLGQWITKIAGLVAIVALLIMMAVVAANVIGRGFFSEPVLGTVELVGLAGVFLISFAVGLTERDQAHIRVMILISRLPPRIQSLFAIFALILSMGTVVLLIWGGILQVWDAIVRPEMVTPVLRVPTAPFISVWVLGCLFLFAFLLKHLIDELAKVRRI
jgi:TRAP-type C4-dicarboxylate transport system permease small subunit